GRSSGSPHTPGPHRRMAPNPRRFTVVSPPRVRLPPGQFVRSRFGFRVAILHSCLERIPLTLKRKRHGSLTPRLGRSLASRRLKPFRFNQSGTRIAQGTLSQANRRRRRRGRHCRTALLGGHVAPLAPTSWLSAARDDRAGS